MINKAYFGDKPIKQIYLNGSTLLPVKPTAKANFLTGEYKKEDGSVSTFAELFNFSRAGKAWFVKDTGLQEYATDIARIDKGLIIEQSTTNELINTDISALTIKNASIISSIDPTVATQYQIKSLAVGEYYFSTTMSSSKENQVLGIYLKRTTTDKIVSVSPMWSNDKTVSILINLKTGTSSSSPLSAAFKNFKVLPVGKDWWYVEALRGGAEVYRWFLVGSPKGDAVVEGENFYAAFPQYLSIDAKPLEGRSPILTNGAAVTRPADYLTVKKPVSKITGDWDATLNISVVAGQLVHSGYGRIRKMEIEYV